MIARGTGYVRGPITKALGRKLAGHFKYLQYRTFGTGETREDRRIFNDQEEAVERKAAVKETLEHTTSAVDYHKIVLSPSEDEDRAISDYYEWTRNIMHDLETHLGLRLHWYAVKHAHQREQIDAPHIHVILAGCGENLETGRCEAVRLYTGSRGPRGRDDYEFMKASALKHCDYEFWQQIQKAAQELKLHTTTPPREPYFLEDHAL